MQLQCAEINSTPSTHASLRGTFGEPIMRDVGEITVSKASEWRSERAGTFEASPYELFHVQLYHPNVAAETRGVETSLIPNGGMDSWHPANLETMEPPPISHSINNLPVQSEQPFNSHTFLPPAARPNVPRKYTAEDWEAQKSEIARLYNDGTLENVRNFMSQRHGLNATPKQYKDRIRKWGFDKNIKTEEMEAMIRKQQERALQKKGTAFRVRKRPINPEKINRYIKEHPERPGPHDNLDVDINIESAATPAGISVYTPSNTGPRTPLAAPSPQEISNGYTVASPQHTFSSEAQNPNLYRFDFVNRQTSDPPSILSNPALFSTSPTPRPHTPHNSAVNPASITPNSRSPSPAISISSIIRSTTSTFTGQSPAIAPRTLSILPQVSSLSSEGFQNKARLSLSGLSSSTQTESHVTASPEKRYNQEEEEQLRGELSMMAIMFGESHSEYLSKSTELAWVLSRQGRYKSAEEIIRIPLSVYPNKNADDIHKFEALNALGAILCYQGSYTKAEKIFMRTIQFKKGLLGSEHDSTLETALYAEQERWQEAENLIVQVMDASKRVLGQEHPGTIRRIVCLAHIWKGYGRYAEALELKEECVQLYTRVLGKEHPETVSCTEEFLAWQIENIESGA
ncbi:hypothetical protein G7Y89_g9490 [Cudoniella acicularis]|uniref:Clr5 domain-containing protein n=1 Tax=Cudoniella acicularis TaxID=354080 RepID=A0A8H4W2J6_9HELO|nr:hypothetical protein G7Y89_g9490 [Cudoniella acicularis]